MNLDQYGNKFFSSIFIGNVLFQIESYVKTGKERSTLEVELYDENG